MHFSSVSIIQLQINEGRRDENIHFKVWINGILKGIRGICSGHRTSMFSKSVSLLVHTKLLQSFQVFATPWTVAHQASLSIGFSRQEY